MKSYGSAATHPNVLFLLGGPGAGKGTQSERICQEFVYEHLSVGDLLRQEATTPGSEHGAQIAKLLTEGKLVPADIVLKLLERAMRAKVWQGGYFLIDGFPRNFANIQQWEKTMAHRVNIKGYLLFDCPEEVLEERMVQLGQVSGRLDDNVHTIRKRIQTFYNESMPVIQFLEREGLLHRINANRHQQEVWAQVEKVLVKMGSPSKDKLLGMGKAQSATTTNWATGLGLLQQAPCGGAAVIDHAAMSSTWASTYSTTFSKQNPGFMPAANYSVVQPKTHGLRQWQSTGQAIAPSLRLAGGQMLTPRR